MIKLNLETSWTEMISMLLEAEPQLSPSDVEFEKGEDEALVRKLSYRLGRSYEHIIGWIESVSSNTSKAS
jgi:hypothetical protein